MEVRSYRKQKKTTTAIHFPGPMCGSAECESLNEIRIKKLKSNKPVKPKRVPPTDDAFLHLLRCQYQHLIWTQTLAPLLQITDFMEHGYETEPESQLVTPQMMTL